MSGQLYGESAGMAIAARLAENYALSKPEITFKFNSLPPSQLARVVDYVKVNLTQSLSISDLVAFTGISETHFSQSFKQLLGITPYQYVMQPRVERAKQLLKQQTPKHGVIAISEIALDCGFANQTHLTKDFCQMTGMIRSVYRRQ